jgi:hypothetical protein
VFDGECDTYENSQSCPADCGTDSGDGYDCLSFNVTPTGATAEVCPGLLEYGLEITAGTATTDDLCDFVTDLFGNATPGESGYAPNSCIADCDYERYVGLETLNSLCDMCLEFSYVDCEDLVGDAGDGFNLNPKISIPASLAGQISKIQGISELDNSLSRSFGCEQGYKEDCFDEDCCLLSWLGDGYCDGIDQEYGCDLACYQNDNGDCGAVDGGGATGTAECAPKDECWYIDDNVSCGYSGCIWAHNASQPYCHPQPSGNANCGAITNQTWCADNDLCEWISDNQGQHCAPKAQGGDCHASNTRDSCNLTTGCQWNAPDWLEDWQTGACMSHNPCLGNNNPNGCENMPDCTWDWDDYKCV